jgi:hypothetical protein
MRKRNLIILTVSLLSLLIGACSTSAEINRPAVSFVTQNAVSFNGSIPKANATAACGNNKYGFIAEIQYVGPTAAKITKHYGPIIPLTNGMPKQMVDSGTVVDGGGGNVDLPFDHSFGGDFSMDITLGSPYAALGQNVGTGQGTPKGEIHVEIQMGEFPHYTSDPLTKSLPASMTWPQFATSAESQIINGFIPQKGDSIAAQGDWILDCGHPDFHSELHELSFLAFGHDAGNAAIVHTFYNPYLPSELFNQNASLAPQVNNPSNFNLSNTYPLIPKFLVNTIIGVVTGSIKPPIEVPMLVAPSDVAPPPFKVCAPNYKSGSNLSISYSFVTRPGVIINHSVDKTNGCVTFSVAFTNQYQTAIPAGQTLCNVPWSWLNQNAAPYTPNGRLNLQKEILTQVTKIDPSAGQSVSNALKYDIQVDCFNLLSSDIGPVNNSSQSVTVDPNQEFPFVGWAKATSS